MGGEAMRLGVRAFILETASIERDVLLCDLTMDEIEQLVHAVLATTALGADECICPKCGIRHGGRTLADPGF